MSPYNLCSNSHWRTAQWRRWAGLRRLHQAESVGGFWKSGQGSPRVPRMLQEPCSLVAHILSAPRAEQVALLSMGCKSVLGHPVLDGGHELCVRPPWD